MEDLAQTTVDPRGRTVTRQELFSELKELGEEVSHLRTHYFRRKSLLEKRTGWQHSINPPLGYASFTDYLRYGLVDMAFNYDTVNGMTGMPSWHDRYFAMVDRIRLERDQLRTYAARRTGDPENRRRQNRDQWERWAGGAPPSWSVGLIREWARARFKDGREYERTLWEVAHEVMLYRDEQLDRRRADTVKKAVDLEYRSQYSNFAPKPPRGWWRPAPDAGSLTPAGLKIMGLAWDPSHQAGDHPWFDKPRVS